MFLICGQRKSARIRHPDYTGHWICVAIKAHEGPHEWAILRPLQTADQPATEEGER